MLRAWEPGALAASPRLPPTGWSTKWTPATKHAALLAAIEEVRAGKAPASLNIRTAIKPLINLQPINTPTTPTGLTCRWCWAKGGAREGGQKRGEIGLFNLNLTGSTREVLTPKVSLQRQASILSKTPERAFIELVDPHINRALQSREWFKDGNDKTKDVLSTVEMSILQLAEQIITHLRMHDGEMRYPNTF
ncbi:hypothetical protein AK812_SmicGene41601 [Symbiodinium microadriaticum]|uniref:Uncharacterized protein n=1 Tax=Symbiodinium microadriaticum TaxID=2951 RepID=A0A1Q9C5S2_SYMMI|nr:hypothetical protein AK812_SmicGene41601 [Symbiodinium microadriaticum]